MRKGQIKEREKLFTRYVHIQINAVLSLQHLGMGRYIEHMWCFQYSKIVEIVA